MYNFSPFAIILPKIIKISGNEVLTKTILHSFLRDCVYKCIYLKVKHATPFDRLPSHEKC